MLLLGQKQLRRQISKGIQASYSRTAAARFVFSTSVWRPKRADLFVSTGASRHCQHPPSCTALSCIGAGASNATSRRCFHPKSFERATPSCVCDRSKSKCWPPDSSSIPGPHRPNKYGSIKSSHSIDLILFDTVNRPAVSLISLISALSCHLLSTCSSNHERHAELWLPLVSSSAPSLPTHRWSELSVVSETVSLLTGGRWVSTPVWALPHCSALSF